MKRKAIILSIVFLLVFSCAISVAAEDSVHIFDEAGLLDDTQWTQLNTMAQQISETYSCSIYIVTVEDHRQYGESEVYDLAWGLYQENDFGYGENRDGMLLLLSMAQRDFATYFYGEAEYAFNAYGQEQLEGYFLDNFKQDDWYGGFADYLQTSEQFLAQAAAGDPVRKGVGGAIVIAVLISCAIALVVVLIIRSGMKTAHMQTTATDYISADGLKLTLKLDRFTHRTRTVRKIQKQSSSSVAHSGGGGSGRSGKF